MVDGLVASGDRVRTRVVDSWSIVCKRIVGGRGHGGCHWTVGFEQSDGGSLSKVVDIITRTDSTAARVGVNVVVAVFFHIFLVVGRDDDFDLAT